jgi:hypothetical protein
MEKWSNGEMEQWSNLPPLLLWKSRGNGAMEQFASSFAVEIAGALL